MRIFWKLDLSVLVALAFLSAVSLLVLFGLSTGKDVDYFVRQSVYVALGIVLFFLAASTDYRHLAKYSTALYFLTAAVLLIVLFFGATVRGTAGWLSFGIFSVQPVEIAKVTLIIFLASFISQKKTELSEWTRIIASFILAALFVFLVLRQPDLGSSIVLLSIWGGMLLASGIGWRKILVMGVLASIFIGGSWFFLDEYQKDRIETFLDPTADPQGAGYNVLQSIVAVGSGGIFGKGIGQGTQSQLNFLPEKHTDFIFAAASEELGLLGAALILGAYAILFYRIKRIGDQAPDNFGYLYAVGLMCMFFVQVAINIGMNIGLLPVTGIPAPFLSYGGSSLLSLFLAFGILVSIYRHRRPSLGTVFTLEKSIL